MKKSLEERVRKIYKKILNEETWVDAAKRTGLPDEYFQNESIAYFQEFDESFENIINWLERQKTDDVQKFKKMYDIYKTTKTYNALK